MAKINIFAYHKKKTKKRKGRHSKNASKSQSAFSKKYRGQGR